MMPATRNSKSSSNHNNGNNNSDIHTKTEFLNNLPIASYICDLNGSITYYNDAAAALWGRKPEIGVDSFCGFSKIYNTFGDVMDTASNPIARSIKKAITIKGEEVIAERADGILKHVKHYSEPIFANNKEMTGAINTLVDITWQRKKEALLIQKDEKYKRLSESIEQIVEKRTSALKKSEEKYHKMVVEIQDYAILLLDERGNIMNWNRGAEKIKGYSEAEVIGKNFSIFYLDSDRKSKLPQKLINEAKRNGRAMHEGLRLRKDGTTFWGYIVITALHNEKGKVIGYSKVTRDLTERKCAEDQMKSFAHDIEVRNHQLEEYAYIASHDLQEPIRKIQIFSELLKDSIDDKESVLVNAEKINKSAYRMSQLIKEVLKYSQLSKGAELMQPTDLNVVLQNVKEDLDLFIAEKNAVISHGELPVINAIPVQMQQLFFNLIGNAVKFGGEKPIIEITSSIPYKSSGEKEKYLRLTISDNGIGFDQQYASQVFKLFKRLNTGHKGTGIGLALCKKIVENHSGEISVDSEIGKGTTFQISIPIS